MLKILNINKIDPEEYYASQNVKKKVGHPCCLSMAKRGECIKAAVGPIAQPCVYCTGVWVQMHGHIPGQTMIECCDEEIYCWFSP